MNDKLVQLDALTTGLCETIQLTWIFLAEVVLSWSSWAAQPLDHPNRWTVWDNSVTMNTLDWNIVKLVKLAVLANGSYGSIQ